MVSVLLRGLYCVTKEGHCQLVPLMCALPVSKNQDLIDKGEMLAYVEWTQK